jgi:hypothetical protein
MTTLAAAHAQELHQETDNIVCEIQERFDLTHAQMGRLFNVTPEAARQWTVKGLPNKHAAKASVVAAIADLLYRKLKHSRIPGIIQRPAAAYQGKSILEMIETDQQNQLLELIRQSFDWSTPA